MLPYEKTLIIYNRLGIITKQRKGTTTLEEWLTIGDAARIGVLNGRVSILTSYIYFIETRLSIHRSKRDELLKIVNYLESPCQ